jgi:DNA-binding MarR family transcriptional regulator
MCSVMVTDAVRPASAAYPRPDPAGTEIGSEVGTEGGTEIGTQISTQTGTEASAEPNTVVSTVASTQVGIDVGTGSGSPADREGQAVWRYYLRGHATVTRALEAELLAQQELSLAAYDVLAELAQAPQLRMRMTELADAVLLSRSGVTRMVDRLERLGLVTRGRVLEDGRGIAATLTDQGREQLGRASVTHLAAVQRHFVNRLDEADMSDLRRISQRLGTGVAASVE